MSSNIPSRSSAQKGGPRPISGRTSSTKSMGKTSLDKPQSIFGQSKPKQATLSFANLAYEPKKSAAKVSPRKTATKEAPAAATISATSKDDTTKENVQNDVKNVEKESSQKSQR